jgi:endonuclease YncB( thermonuclease family)
MHQPAMPLRPGGEHCTFQTDRRLRYHATHTCFQLEGTVPLQEMQAPATKGLRGGEVAGLTALSQRATISPEGHMSNRFAVLLVGAGVITLGVTTAAEAGNLSGNASVIDGDTIEIRGERIRILDIDAPELGQLCFSRDNGIRWPCGQLAAHALAGWLDHYPVTCETKGTDILGRWFARCEVATVSIATLMAGNGWAVPSQECRCQEVRAWASFAESKMVGIWAGKFQMPWEWRKAN